mgnify:CR=1 FL=1
MQSKRTDTLRRHARSAVIAACALVMLAAYFLLSPWVGFNPGALAGAAQSQAATGLELSGNMQPPAGFEPPAGFQAPQAAQSEGNMSSSQGAATTGTRTRPNMSGLAGAGFAAAVPGQTGLFLVPLGALMALGAAAGRVARPARRRLFSALAALAGLVALAYFAIFFMEDARIPISFAALAAPGFWAALAASAVLIASALIPGVRQRSPDDASASQLVRRSRKRGGLSLHQNIAVSLDALLANKLRSGLTMLGVIIGVASVVSLTSIGQGAQSAVTERLGQTGLDLLTVTSGGGGFARPGGAPTTTRTKPLTLADAEAIETGVSGIRAVLPQYSGMLNVRVDQSTYSISVVGTTEMHANVSNLAIEIGRFFDAGEYESNARVVVLGADTAEEMFGGLNPVGRSMRIGRTTFEVIGVLEEQDTGIGSNPNQEVYVPLTTALANLFNARIPGSTDTRVSSIVVAVQDPEQINTVSSGIEALLRQRHDLAADADNDFNIINRQQLIETANSVTGILTILLGAIASISLLVGGIGIMNITLVSVTERTREIGLRKAVGARRGHILQQFLFETITLSTLGGVFGTLLGVGISGLVNNSGLLTTSITVESLVIGLGFSVLVGVFFGVYPANQAAGLQPIEALRYE